jgi:hypothetical protein
LILLRFNNEKCKAPEIHVSLHNRRRLLPHIKMQNMHVNPRLYAYLPFLQATFVFNPAPPREINPPTARHEA